MRKSVIIINDNLEVCKQIKYNLQNESTDVYYARSVHKGLQNFLRYSYTLVIMDIALSETDGLELLETLRRARKLPILVLSGKCSTEDKVRALSAGADDFLPHPFDVAECLARAQALMRRYTELGGDDTRCYTLAFGPELIIEPQYRRATLHGKPLHLTRTEFNMLYFMARHAGQVLSMEQLYSGVWADETEFNVECVVRTQLKGLRGKLAPGGKEYIQNVWGVGYCFAVEDTDKLK